MRFLSFFICLFFSQFFEAQGFRSRLLIPNALTNEARAIFETTAGNYIAAGIIVDTVFTAYQNRMVIMGLNNYGQLIWSKKYGSASPVFFT